MGERRHYAGANNPMLTRGLVACRCGIRPPRCIALPRRLEMPVVDKENKPMRMTILSVALAVAYIGIPPQQPAPDLKRSALVLTQATNVAARPPRTPPSAQPVTGQRTGGQKQ